VYTERLLDNGVNVTLDSSLGVRSVTICISLEAGALCDEPGSFGFAHLLEHLVMAAPVAEPTAAPAGKWVDSVGGHSNASTSHDAVVFWARVPPAAARECAQIMDHAVAAPVVTNELCASERLVVIQELLAANANPIDLAEESLYRNLFGDHPMGRPVGGSTHDFPQLTADYVMERHKRNLISRPLDVSLIGPQDALGDVFAVLDDGELGNMTREPQAPRSPAPIARVGGAGESVGAPDGGFVHLAAGGIGAPRGSSQWGAAEVLAAAVGGTPGSSLYARLRGELGVSYGLQSSHSAYRDVGVWSVLVGAAQEHADVVQDAVASCLADVAGGALGEEGFLTARRQALGSALLDNEDPVALAYLNSTWVGALDHGAPPLALVQRLISEVDHDAVQAVAANVLESYTYVFAS
jgi:predicted Zn-dependent peptidase